MEFAERFEAESGVDTMNFGKRLAHRLRAGDTVLFTGELGAGKTTLIRGIVAELGHLGPVRSPTFNLIKLYEGDPPILHADLYRLGNAEGIGLEEYLDRYLCLIEWPDRLGAMVNPEACWRVDVSFTEKGRRISVEEPWIAGG